MSEATQQFYQNPNNKAKASYLQGVGAGDWWVLSITTIATITAWVAVNNARLDWWWALLITTSMLLNVHVEYARLYKEMLQLLQGAFIFIFVSDILWEAEPTGNRLQRFFRERRYRLSADRRAPIPLSHQFVEATVDGVRRRYGVLDELDTDSGYMGVLCRGSAYNDVDYASQQRIHADLSRALNSFFGSHNRRLGVTEIRIERPDDTSSIDATIAESGDPFMFYPDGLPSDIDPWERRFDLDEDLQGWAEFRSLAFGQMRPKARQISATRNWQVLLISFKWKSVATRAIRGKLDSEQINDLPLIELGRTLCDEIAGIPGLELQDPHVMSPIELAEFTRCGLVPDVQATERYYADRVLGRIVTKEEDLEVVTAEMVAAEPEVYKKSDVGSILSELSAWPEKRIVVKSDRILIDDTWFMVVRFTQTPEVEHPTKAQRIHFALPPGVWGGHAEVSERTSGSIDTNVLMTKEAAYRSLEEARSRKKIVVNPNIRRRQERARLGLEQVSLESTNQRYLPVSHLTAPLDNPKLLDKRFMAYRTAMKSQGISVAKVKGRVRMLDAVITAVIGINRL